MGSGYHSNSAVPVWRNWWLVRFTGSGGGVISLGRAGDVTFPNEWIGRRVRFRVEVID
mgnify:CR=1 FL=1